MTQIAAELIGRVSAHPTSTETVIPIMTGLSMVALLITAPRCSIMSLIGEQHHLAKSAPVTIVTKGVTIMSTGVFFDASWPSPLLITTAR